MQTNIHINAPNTNSYYHVVVQDVDAVRDHQGGWDINDVMVLKTTTLPNDVLNSSRRLLSWLRNHRFLTDASKGHLKVDDQDTTILILIKNNQRPIIALELSDRFYK